MKKLLSVAITLLLPAACLASPVVGPIMFLGDSITLGADSVDPNNGGPAHGGAGYRGYLIGDLISDGATFSTIGTSTQNAGSYLNTAGYIQEEGHAGATIQNLYTSPTNPYGETPTYQIATVAFDQSSGNSYYTPQFEYGDAAVGAYAAPKYVYLMIGSNNAMNSPTQIAQNLSDELSLISYIHSVDSGLSRIFVEPPPSYPSASEGNTPNGYDTFSTNLGAALLTPPYSGYTTFVDSRPELDSASDYAIENNQQQYLHPSDAGYEIIANDLYDATIAAPEPGQLSYLLPLACLFLVRPRRRCAS